MGKLETKIISGSFYGVWQNLIKQKQKQGPSLQVKARTRTQTPNEHQTQTGPENDYGCVVMDDDAVGATICQDSASKSLGWMRTMRGACENGRIHWHRQAPLLCLLLTLSL